MRANDEYDEYEITNLVRLNVIYMVNIKNYCNF